MQNAQLDWCNITKYIISPVLDTVLCIPLVSPNTTTGARGTELPPSPFFLLFVYIFICNIIALFLYYFISFSLFYLVRVHIHTILC